MDRVYRPIFRQQGISANLFEAAAAWTGTRRKLTKLYNNGKEKRNHQEDQRGLYNARQLHTLANLAGRKSPLQSRNNDRSICVAPIWAGIQSLASESPIIAFAQFCIHFVTFGEAYDKSYRTNIS